MSSATGTYVESVAFCLPPTPLLRSPPLAAAAAPPRLPVRRRVDFTGDSGLGDDDHEAKRRATQGPAPPPAFREKPCICGRGPCDVVWKERGGWAYVCSSPPKCVHFAWCEESDLNINSQPAYRRHPEPSNPRAFNTPSNHRAGATTPVNVSPQGAGITPPVNVSPQGSASPITPRSNCCFRCGEEGHWCKNCPKLPTPCSRCFRCGEGGHWCKNCPKPPPPCSRCGDVGHRSRDCPKFSPQPDICFHCGEVGHWKIHCPALRDGRAF